MAKIGLKDIACRAEVSISTVSRVINDPDQVNAETRERVYAVMRELDYKTGFQAGHQEENSVLAVISPKPNSEFFMDLFTALEKEMQPHGVYPMMVNSRRENSLSVFLSRDSSWARIASMAVIIHMDVDERARDFLESRHMPVAMVHTRNPWFFSVLNNNYLGGYDAASYLWDKGYRRPAVVKWSETPDLFQSDRLTGFYKAFEEHGISSEKIPEEDSIMSIEGGAACTKRILSRFQPDVIFFTSDTMAMGGLEVCRERHISVPGELAVMGFDDIRMAAPMNLTTMKQFIPAKARAVTDHLIRCRNDLFPGSHAEEYPGELTMTPVLVERLTT